MPSAARIYMDHSATTPVDPAVVEEMLPYFSEHYGNAASRNHAWGWVAAEAVDIARARVAALIGATPEEIVFTSGATESNNLAIKGVAELYASKGRHLITCATEHKAVLDPCAHLQRQGWDMTVLPVDGGGHIDLDRLRDAIREDTVLIALMAANNETGLLHPVREISGIARERGVPFFSDATQAVGRIPVDVDTDGIDAIAFTAHKFYGPKGCGALYLRRRSPRVRVAPLLDGGGHERGFRSGTLNVPGIVGMGKAAEIAIERMESDRKRLAGLRDRLEAGLKKLGKVKVNGDSEYRLPHLSNLRFEGVRAESLLGKLGSRLACSTASACSSADLEPSHVLMAMGLSEESAGGSLRFSLGRGNDEAQVDQAVAWVGDALGQLRSDA